MDQIENPAQTSLSNGSENGVAPHSDSSTEVLDCLWLLDHRSGWQYGESGVIKAIFSEITNDIPEEHRWCVEFGAGNGSASLPLTCEHLLRTLEYKALLIDANPEYCDALRASVPKRAVVVNGIVDIAPAKTIDEYMKEAGCPGTPALMVIDVDSIDYHIAAGMEARPYVLCIEHMDQQWPMCPRAVAVPSREDCGKPIIDSAARPFTAQATLEAVEVLARKMGYSLVFNTAINGIYVRNDIWPKVAKPAGKSVRLNIGAGAYSDPRYTDIDIKNGIDARHLPYADNSVDEIYASHILEHFSFRETATVLAEWARVLRPGGIMRIAVPNATMLTQDLADIAENGSHEALENVFFGAQATEAGTHKALFTEQRLRERMNEAGIGYVKRFEPFIPGDCSNAKCSINFEGVKRWWPKIEKPTVSLILNQPRLAFTGHEIRLIELAKKLDFNIHTCSGSFWDRDMTAATQSAIAYANPDFLLYSDYDSVFETEDATKLLETINNDPTMAAIGAVQMSRHNDRPLVFEAHIDYMTPISRVTFQHFGLMIIRRQVFEELQKPWYWSIPGKDAKGNWDWDAWGRTDADITFWRNMSLMGFRVYQHNEVCIGHIIQAVKYPRNSGRGVQLIPIENYWKQGKPKDATLNPACYLPPKPPTEAPPTNG